MAPAISVTDLRVRRGGRLVMPGVSVAVAAGSVTGLLGPSGSGKTTLMWSSSASRSSRPALSACWASPGRRRCDGASAT